MSMPTNAQATFQSRTKRIASWEWWVDRDGIVWSPNVAQVVKSRQIDPVSSWSAFKERCLPEDRAQLESGLQQAITIGQPFELLLRYQVEESAGRTSWLTLTGIPYFDENGRPNRLVGTLRNSEQERRVETLIASTPDPLITFDQAGLVTYANRRFSAVFGWELTEIAGRPLDFVPPERVDEIDMLAATLLENTELQSFETQRLTRDGRLIDVELSAELLLDLDDQPLGAVYMLRDVSTRKRQEEELARRWDNLEQEIGRRTADLRTSEARLTQLVEQSPLGIVEWDENFHVRRWNKAAERIFGYSAAEAIGQHARFNLPEEVWPQIDRLWHHLMSLEGGEHSINKNVTAGGRVITCEWFNQTLLDEAGRPRGVISFVEDITTRIAGQEALQQQAATLENMGEAVITADMNFVIKGWNAAAAELYGYTAAEVIGRPISNFIIETIYHNYQGDIGMQELFARGKFSDRARQKLANGRELIIKSTASLIFDENGDPSGVVAVNQDITQAVQAEAERERLIGILENTPIFVGMATPDQKLTYMNKFGRDLLGYPLRGELDIMALDVVAPPSHPTVLDGINIAIDRGQWNGEIEFRREDGTPLPVSQVIMSHRDPTGELTHLSSIARDISEEKAQQREIAVRLRLSQALAGAVSEEQLLDIITANTDFHPHVAVLVTRAGRTNETGEAAHEVVGANLHDSDLKWLPPGAQLLFPEFIEETLGRGEPYLTVDMQSDRRLDDRSRRFAETFRARSVALFPLFGVDGERYGTLHLQTGLVGFFQPHIVDRYRAVAEEISLTLQNIFLSRRIQESLERRSREFEITAQIAQEVSSGESLTDVYHRVVNRVHESFGFYHTQLLQYNPGLDAVGLVVGYGEVGAAMRESGHTMPMGVGLIGRAAATGRSVLRPHVRQDPSWKPNPLLPETRGELAVPIKFQDRVLGVLDVQSNQQDALTEEDQVLLEGLCGVIAVAIESARLREEMASRLEELNALQRVMSRDSWNAMRSRKQLGFLFDQADVQPLDEIENGRQTGSRRGTNGGSATASTATAHLIARPLEIRGEMIGTLAVQDTADTPLSSEERRLLDEISVQVAEALENARLLEQTQRRAVEMETVAQLSSTTAAILEQAQLLQSVTDLTKQSFGLHHVHILLFTPERNALQLAAASGQLGAVLLVEGMHISLGQGGHAAVEAFKAGKGRMNNEIAWDEHTPLHPLLRETRSLISIPMMAGSKALGVMELMSTQPNAFESTDLSVFTTLANQVAISMQNASLYQEQKETAEKLREVDRLKSEFLASMSHELRTPLNSIIGFADVLLEGIDGDLNERMREDVLLIRDGGRHLRNLIGEILDMSKIEAGMMDLSYSMVDLPQIVREVIGTTNSLLQGKPVEAISHIDPDIGVIEADRTRLVQILLNVLSNAAKFTDRGLITLGLERRKDDLLVRVQDTGIGIQEEDIPLVFQQFRQVGGMEHRKAGGTGLGMPITRHLVELHGGRIWLESVYGVGTTFFFTIPFKRPAKKEEGGQRYYR